MKLLQMSLAGGVMILVITVIRALAIERLPKKTFLALWAAALARLLAPVSLSSALSIYSLLARRVPAAAEWTAVPALPDLPVAAETAAAAAAQQTASAPAAQAPVWTIVWAVGVAVCAVVFAAAYGRCCREFRASFPVESEVTRRWLQSHPLRRTIAIRRSGRISSPLTFGVLRPVILMPKKTDWTDETALRYVLEHEFVHIQRFDVLSKLLLIAAICVHWFNPLVWVMYVLANRDLELSCDETVLRRFGGDVRAAYARVLIRMEAARGGFAPLCNHFGKNAIEERITSNHENKTDHHRISGSRGAARRRDRHSFRYFSPGRYVRHTGKGIQRVRRGECRVCRQRRHRRRVRRTAAAGHGLHRRRDQQQGPSVVLRRPARRHDLR